MQESGLVPKSEKTASGCHVLRLEKPKGKEPLEASSTGLYEARSLKGDERLASVYLYVASKTGFGFLNISAGFRFQNVQVCASLQINTRRI